MTVPQRQEAAAASAAAPLQILLVEDDEFDVAVFRRAFRQAGIPCEIVRCSRAEEALEGLRDTVLPLDLLVTDHFLPGMSGLDLCLELIEQRPPFALVLLTGAGSETVAIQALKAGVHDYIVKDSSQEYLELLPLVLPQLARRHRNRVARRRAEEKLRNSREAALEVSRVKSQLLAEVGREVRAPLDAIRQAAQRLDGTASAEAQRDLERIYGAIDHLRELADHIQGLARIEDRDARHRSTPFSLARLLGEVLRNAATAAAAKGLELSCEVAAGVPDGVSGDPVRLRLVLAHLIDNAVVFTGAGRIELRLEPAADGVRFTVADTGKGIAPERCAHLFEALPRTLVSRGSSLGLPICADLVRLMGGEIEVESEVEKGTAFHFTLPLAAAPEADVASPERSELEGGRWAPLTSRRHPRPTGEEGAMVDEVIPLPQTRQNTVRVLVVHANPIIAYTAARIVERLGCQFVPVTSGVKALEALDREGFDVVLTGLRMAELDGFETARRIRAAGHQVPIIGLCVDPKTGEAERCLSAGMNGFVPRPLAPAALRQALSRAL